MTLRAVLFDADGVVQQNPSGWLADVRRFVSGRDGAAFTDDLFAAEASAMLGERDFREVVAEVAGRWGVAATGVEELLGHWHRIEVSEPVLRLVAELRERGLRCCLASNQNAFRAAYMQAEVGYADRFDASFYSCDLGVLKSSPAFFDQVLDRLDLPADEVAFVDDTERYVDVARRRGLPAVLWCSGQGVEVLRDRLGL